MKFFTKINITLVLALTLQFGTAQTQTVKEADKLSLNSGTIDSQFEYLIQKSNRYQDFKVVKTTWLYTLKAHTLDSLKVIKNELIKTQNLVSTQTNKITTLNSDLLNTKSALLKIEVEKNSMTLFGIQMNKIAYNTLLWAIIAGILILLFLFIYKFKASNSITKQAKLKLQDVELEYEDHRRIALEREQKVRRQLQDEINKGKTKS